MTRTFLRTSVTGVALAAVLGMTPVAAQQSTQGGGSGEPGQQGSAQQAQQGGTEQAMSPDTVIATVGGSDIVGADLIAFLETLPPQMRQQPPQMLLSMGVEQLVLRELFLQEAQSQNLSQDPRVTAIVEEAGQTVQEDAMVEVYLQDQLDSRVTDEAVQQTYEQLQSQAPEGESLPPLEEVRSQIEQQLRQQALLSIREDLTEGAEVIFYGAGGVPMDESASGSQSDASASGDSASDGSSQASDAPQSE